MPLQRICWDIDKKIPWLYHTSIKKGIMVEVLAGTSKSKFDVEEYLEKGPYHWLHPLSGHRVEIPIHFETVKPVRFLPHPTSKWARNILCIKVLAVPGCDYPPSIPVPDSLAERLA